MSFFIWGYLSIYFYFKLFKPFSASNSLKSCRDIEQNVIPSLINVCDWLKANKLSINTIKTEFMLIVLLITIRNLIIFLL